MHYATAMGCDGDLANGTANIDLQGTPFAVDDTFVTDDLGIGSATFSASDQVVDLTGGGFCGWTPPGRPTSTRSIHHPAVPISTFDT